MAGIFHLNIDFGRLKQVLRFGWSDTSEICKLNNYSYNKQLRIYLDVIFCFFKYRMKSIQYFKNDFYRIDKQKRSLIANKLLEENQKRDEWYKDSYDTKKFLAKYNSMVYDSSITLQEKRNKAFKERFHFGNNCWVHYNVTISREHFVDGEINVGNNVLFGKNSFIDYTGNITIKDGVRITNGVIIETHSHLYHSDFKASKDEIKTCPLTIETGAVIGCRAIIMSGVNYIGKYARVGAGAVVTHSVPDYAIVAGVPAKVLKYQTPE